VPGALSKQTLLGTGTMVARLGGAGRGAGRAEGPPKRTQPRLTMATLSEQLMQIIEGQRRLEDRLVAIETGVGRGRPLTQGSGMLLGVPGGGGAQPPGLGALFAQAGPPPRRFPLAPTLRTASPFASTAQGAAASGSARFFPAAPPPRSAKAAPMRPTTTTATRTARGGRRGRFARSG